MRPGDVIGDRFELQTLKGQGAMGAVFRALDRERHEVVAVKLVRGSHLQAAQRFAREAHVLAGLEHPGIVRYLAHGDTRDGQQYLVMEWLEGQSLDERLDAGPLDLEATLALGHRVAEALGFAHARGIVHRDVKPDNLFLPGGDVTAVKVLDFGIARPGRASRAMTRVGMQLGTPGYMAPEQVRGTTTVDARADVFALGCVLYECLTGLPAFTAEDIMALLSKILLEPAPRVREHFPDVPDALDDLIARMLAKDREARPADGRAVAEALAALDTRPSAALAPGDALTGGEQRLLCVVLADTAHVALEDDDEAETFATLEHTTGAPRGLNGVVEACGGRLERLPDGTVVATVSGTGAATDLAAQAARCALAMRAHLPPDVPFALATGPGAASSSSRGLAGAALDRAAALLRAHHRARGGEIRLDEVSAALLDARFDLARGAAGITLQGEREALDPSRPLLGRATPCVGRERELALLRAAYDECVTQGRARAVLVTGAAGVGKSRVRHELLRGLQGLSLAPEVLLGRGDPMRAGSAFGLLAGALRRAAGVTEADDPPAAQARLAARVAASLAGDDAVRVAEFLCELAGLGFPDEDRVQLRAARHDPILMGDQMRRAWEDFVAAESAVRPVVLVLEDLQWGDLPSVSYVEGALQRLESRPVLALALARPEVREVFPDLWRERGVREVRLGDLPPAAAWTLATTALGPRASDEVVAKIVERAGGNAFFLEELIRAAGRGGTDLPESVLAMVQARLAALGPDARRVLRAASVFGMGFTREGVRALVSEMDPARLDRALLALVAGEAVELRDTGSGAATEGVYAFRHALVREAAYGTLTDGDRALGHRLAGAWLERAGTAGPTGLAEHFERGGEAARAAEWYARAAAHAVEGDDFAAALDRAERALACGAEDELRGAVRLAQAEAHRWRGERDAARGCAVEALSLLPPGARRWYVAAGEVAIALGKAGEVRALEDLARDVEATEPAARCVGAWIVASARAAMQLLVLGRGDLAGPLLDRLEKRALGLDPYDPAVAARLHAARGLQALFAGDPAANLRRLRAAVWSYEQAGDLRNACTTRMNIGVALTQLGAWAEAADTLRTALAATQRAGMVAITDATRANLVRPLAHLGAVEEACILGAQAVAGAGLRGDPRMEGGARIYLAEALLLADDLPGAEREARAAVRVLAGTAPLRAFALGRLAAVLLAREAPADALAVAREAMDALERLGGIEEGDGLVRLAWAEALRANGRRREALDAVTAAQARLEERAARITDPALRARFLAGVPEHARTLACAGEWAADGEPEADDGAWIGATTTDRATDRAAPMDDGGTEPSVAAPPADGWSETTEANDG